MSTDSSSSPHPNEPTLDHDTQVALLSYIEEKTSEAPAGTEESDIFRSAAQYMHDERKAQLTIDNIKHIVKSAREKRRKRKQTQQRAEERAREAAAKEQEYEEQKKQQRTRRELQLFIETTPHPQSASSLVVRTASIVTDAAVRACGALDALRERNKQLSTHRTQHARKSKGKGSPAHRPALADITNSPNVAAVEESSAPPVSSAPSSPVDRVRQSLSAPSSPYPALDSSSSSPPSSPAVDVSSPSPSVRPAFGAALLPPGRRINAQKRRKEMKRMIAQESADMVKEELERRRKQDEAIEKTSQVMDRMLALFPLLEAGLAGMAKRSEEKDG